MIVGMSYPSSKEQFYQQMQITYPDKKELSKKMKQYFEHQQFDDLEDLLEDIKGEYDDCCCKVPLFNILKIFKLQKTMDEYKHLQSSMKNVKSNCETTQSLTLQKMCKDITSIFSIHFTPSIVDYISTLFVTFVKDEEV